ncbi:hypothetical protein BJX70DRAFT_30515 [Aspergillus crustosus]
MGQIQLPPSPPPTQPSSSASDELPSYDQAAAQPPLFPASTEDSSLAPPPDAYHTPGQQKYHSLKYKNSAGGVVTIGPDFASNPESLAEYLTAQTRIPPRQCLLINGSHKESRKSGNDTKTESVTDFNFTIDLTRTILRWGRNETAGPSQRWSYTTVVSDNDEQKAYRGGRIRTRSQKPGRIALPEGDGDGDGDGEEGARLMDLENAEDTENYPGLKGWCQRFCNDPSPVKSFTFRRRLHGFDATPMRDALTSHIRSTGYQGHIGITPVTANGFVVIYSPHWINKLRNNGFAYWLCIILQLWLLTWPVIWFLERRYEVVRSEWFSSQTIADPSLPGGSGKIYAGDHDEATAAEMWAPVVREAAWQGRKQDEILREAEIETLRVQGIQRREQVGEGRDLVNRGQAMLGMMGIRSIGGVNVTGAWGGDNSSSSSSRFSMRIG